MNLMSQLQTREARVAVALAGITIDSGQDSITLKGDLGDVVAVIINALDGKES